MGAAPSLSGSAIWGMWTHTFEGRYGAAWLGGSGAIPQPVASESALTGLSSWVSQPPATEIVWAEMVPPAPKTSKPSPHTFHLSKAHAPDAPPLVELT